MKYTTEESKQRFLEYYKDLPIQKLAAGFACVVEDTVSLWKKKDPEFLDAMTTLESEWAKNNASKVRDKAWLLERIMKKHFAARTELTGADGKDLPTPITKINVPNNNSVPKDQ